MIDIFLNAARTIEPNAVSEEKQHGKLVVGYTCSYLPAEILHAAHIIPMRLRGIETHSLEIADSYYGPFICTFPKCLLQLASQGSYHFLDGAIISTGCDGMRRLDECWRKAGSDYHGSLPSFFHYFDVPHKRESYAISWFIEEIRKLIQHLKTHFNVKITDDAIRQSIQLYNHGRRLMFELDSLRHTEQVRISGAHAFAVSVAGTILPRELFTEQLALFLNHVKNTNTIMGKNQKRLMVVGSVNDDLELIELIEQCGAIVVSEHLCFGIRNEDDLVNETGDPVAALADRYLSNSACPRMFGYFSERLNLVKEKIQKAHVHGVIMQNIRFCDLHGSENGLMEHALEALGIPCMRIEREYGSLTETGRIKMRIQAFLERIES
ncbi:MAG: 2-hydroxyacyl-CoA dehydratase [Desulfobacterales bacterium]|nr:2-hydroxyacyl-CoA dehydratase [Desulfobacterales bacterium]